MKRENFKTLRSTIALISVMLAGYVMIALLNSISNLMGDRSDGGSLRDVAIVGIIVWILGTLIIWRVLLVLAQIVMNRLSQKEKKKKILPQDSMID